MKKYNTPEAELVAFNVVDVITLSAVDDDAKYDDTVKAPSSWFN